MECAKQAQYNISQALNSFTRKKKISKQALYGTEEQCWVSQLSYQKGQLNGKKTICRTLQACYSLPSLQLSFSKRGIFIE
jgi:hypothetical protein